MARGFESKDVEYQQAEAQRAKSPGRELSVEEREAKTHQSTVELALRRARADLAAATAPAHRRMLEQAIEALEAQLVARQK